jgi:hypothetical protein
MTCASLPAIVTLYRPVFVLVREVMQGWPNAKMSGNNKILPTAYPATLCWKPHVDQDPSEISFDFDAYEKYPDQLGPSARVTYPRSSPRSSGSGTCYDIAQARGV